MSPRRSCRLSRMLSTIAVIAISTTWKASLAAQPSGGTSITERQRVAATRLIEAALADTEGYARLATMTDRFGHRLSGSASLERAVDWILDEMRRDRLDNVRGEPAMVPHWVRGAESAT